MSHLRHDSSAGTARQEAQAASHSRVMATGAAFLPRLDHAVAQLHAVEAGFAGLRSDAELDLHSAGVVSQPGQGAVEVKEAGLSNRCPHAQAAYAVHWRRRTVVSRRGRRRSDRSIPRGGAGRDGFRPRGLKGSIADLARVIGVQHGSASGQVNLVAPQRLAEPYQPRIPDLDRLPGADQADSIASPVCRYRGCHRAAVAPEPSEEPSAEPPGARALLHEATPIDDPELGGPVGEFFAAISAAWPFTRAQRARLAPAVDEALNTGWTPTDLAASIAGNTAGVRNPYAVLAARLSSDDLLAPPRRPTRPLWCGQCDQRTRLLDFDGDAPRPCPRCRADGLTRL